MGHRFCTMSQAIHVPKLVPSDQFTITMPQKYFPLPVMQRIFHAYHTPCHIHPHRKCRIRSCVTSSPLLLGKICKEWRDIAWDMPDLWTWIEVTEFSQNLEVRLQLAREWLDRASGRPLTVIAHPFPFETQSFRTSPNKLFDLIGEYSVQWRVLDVSMYVLRCSSVGIAENQRGLNSLMPTGMGDARNIHSNTGPWAALTSLTLTGLTGTYSDLSTIMGNLPNLKMLRVHVEPISMGKASTGQDDIEPLPNWSGHVILPKHLKSLIVSSSEPSFFFNNVTASESLQRLSIIIGSHGDIPAVPVIDFITRSGCSLRAFGFSTGATIDVESLSLLFTSLPSTKLLYIGANNTRNYKQVANQIPNLLNPSQRMLEGNDILLPNLQVLYYSTFNIGIVPQKLLDMIKCRCRGHDIGKENIISKGEFAKLEILRFNKTNPQVLVHPLRVEIEEGLEITYDLPYRGEPFQ